MKLYTADQSPNAMRVRAVVYELDLPVELIEVDLRSSEKPVGFLAANPNGKVPAFVDDDGFSLFESRAINKYLATKKPERDLDPADPKRRALSDQWSYWQAIHLGPAMQAIAFERVYKARFKLGVPDEAVIKSKQVDVDRFLPVLEALLKGKEWVVDTLSLADFAVASTFQLRDPAQISLTSYPSVDAWIKRVEGLASWQRALPKP
ncbi:MAG TPA: glutathione S-transferase family protein [Polyangiales bacterium]|nr:glutathione S-transferase family protein [Polyangiales bacterium]